MKNIRIIPRLDIKGPNVVKGIHLEGLRVLGRPTDFAKYYYEQGADELIYVDVVASLYGRNSLHDIIKETAKELFIPLTVGGGMRTLDDIKNALRAGADKVSLNTAAILNPDLIRKAAKKFGSSTIIVAIEAIRQDDGQYLAFIDNGREFTGKEVLSWASLVEEMGAGEILITSVDREGTGLGFDIDLISKLSSIVSIPIIAHGGAGKIDDIFNVLNNTSVDAVAIASMLHYDTIKKIKESQNFEVEGNRDFLKSGAEYSKITPITIQSLKDFLLKKEISLRP
jgi:cyclase